MEQEVDGMALTEAAKQAGVQAFGQAVGKGIYHALRDDTLFPEIADLWDCETVGDLKGRVGTGEERPEGAVNALLEQGRAAYLVAALAALGVVQARKRGQGIGR